MSSQSTRKSSAKPQGPKARHDRGEGTRAAACCITGESKHILWTKPLFMTYLYHNPLPTFSGAFFPISNYFASFDFSSGLTIGILQSVKHRQRLPQEHLGV